MLSARIDQLGRIRKDRNEPRHLLQPPDLTALPRIQRHAAELLRRVARERAIPDTTRLDPESRWAMTLAEYLLTQDEAVWVLEEARADQNSIHSRIDADDNARLAQNLLHYGRRAPLDLRIRGWESLVKDMEHPERDPNHTYEEHENSLVSRDNLEAFMPIVGPKSRPVITAPVFELDDRFMAATSSVTHSIAPPKPWRSQNWWWFRVPNARSESFEARLKHVAPKAAAELQDNS